MKIEIKGICKAVSNVQTKAPVASGQAAFRVQTVIATIPGYRDSFGDQKGKDEDWEIQVMNDNIEKHNLLAQDLVGKKVICECFLNSRSFMYGGETKYALNLNLAKLTVYEG